MRACDAEINRAVNALWMTLNDQHVAEFDAGRFTAVAGLTVLRDLARPAAGWVTDGEHRLVEIELGADGHWSVRRLVDPVTLAPLPSRGDDDRARGGSPAPHALSGTNIAPDVGAAAGGDPP